MSGLFSTQTATTVPEAPTVANTQSSMDVAARQQALSLQRGRAATMLTGGAGLSNLGTTSKTLLGQ